MTNYTRNCRYDAAISLAQEWLKVHPEDVSHAPLMYGQIAFIYLSKAIKDRAHEDKWVQLAVAYFDRELSAFHPTPPDVELYEAGRGLEAAGRLSPGNSCEYFGRAVKAFEDEAPFVQGDTFTAYGKTIELAPIRQDIEKSLKRTKAEFAKAGCK